MYQADPVRAKSRHARLRGGAGSVTEERGGALEERELSGDDLRARLRERVERRTVDLRELSELARARGPLQWEGVALHRGGIGVADEGPRTDRLARLPDLAEVEVALVRSGPAGLFAELPTRRDQERLVGLNDALGDGPDAFVAPHEERSPRMDEEKAQRVGTAPNEDEARRVLHRAQHSPSGLEPTAPKLIARFGMATKKKSATSPETETAAEARPAARAARRGVPGAGTALDAMETSSPGADGKKAKKKGGKKDKKKKAKASAQQSKTKPPETGEGAAPAESELPKKAAPKKAAPKKALAETPANDGAELRPVDTALEAASPAQRATNGKPAELHPPTPPTSDTKPVTPEDLDAPDEPGLSSSERSRAARLGRTARAYGRRQRLELELPAAVLGGARTPFGANLGLSPVDLAAHAAEAALRDTELARSAVDAIIFTAERPETRGATADDPAKALASALRVDPRLGAFSIFSGEDAALRGLALAQLLVESEAARVVLLVGADLGPTSAREGSDPDATAFDSTRTESPRRVERALRRAQDLGSRRLGALGGLGKLLGGATSTPRKLGGGNRFSERAEDLAQRFDLPRAELDALALRSRRRVARPPAELAPLRARADLGRGAIEADTVHAPARYEHLADQAPFRQGGRATPGNVANEVDGAAALLIGCHRERPAIREVAFASDRHLPALAPVLALARLLQGRQSTLAELERTPAIVVESSAAAPLAVQAALRRTELVRRLELPGEPVDIPDTRLNPRGGALATGHAGVASALAAVHDAAVLAAEQGGEAFVFTGQRFGAVALIG